MIVKILYFCMNVVLTKQWVKSKLTKTQKVRFWMWSSLQTNKDMNIKVSGFILERVVMLE